MAASRGMMFEEVKPILLRQYNGNKFISNAHLTTALGLFIIHFPIHLFFNRGKLMISSHSNIAELDIS